QALETGAGDLAHQRVAEAIDRPARQEVAFGVEDPIAGGRGWHHAAAERQRLGDALAKEVSIDRSVVGSNQTHADPRARTVEADAERLALGGHHPSERR